MPKGYYYFIVDINVNSVMCLYFAGCSCWWFRKYCQSFNGQEACITLHICDYN